MDVELVPAPRQEVSKTPVKRTRRAGGVPELHRVTKDEIDLACARSRTMSPALLVRFLWVTGARISEALAVTTQDFDFGALCVRLRTLKRRGEHHRALPLPPAFCGELAHWFIFSRPGPADRIFPWKRAAASRIVTRLLVAAGVDRRRAHPHAIRHGHAFHAMAGGVPINALQYQLGHAHISTTAIYPRATSADLRVFYDRVNW